MSGEERDLQPTRQLVETWIGAYQPVVYRAACLILRDPRAAEDVAQETFLRAFRAAHRIDPDSEVRAWLYRIAVNLARNQLRSRRREERALSRLDVEEVLAYDQLEELDAREGVGRALRRLPDRLRMPLVLRYYLDLPEREIARALGTRVSTVKSRLHEARRLLAVDESLRTPG